jgi:hypothetical protein
MHIACLSVVVITWLLAVALIHKQPHIHELELAHMILAILITNQ